jgi:hypothetical protein
MNSVPKMPKVNKTKFEVTKVQSELKLKTPKEASTHY